MNILYWTLFGISIYGIITIATSLYSLVFHFRKKAISQQTSLPVSVVIPIKGVDENTTNNLKALVNSNIETPVEYLFAMETTDDPAYESCKTIKDSFPDKDIQVILTGLSEESMGKQHNINIAVKKARYDTVASMDADVRLSPNALKEGLEALNTPKTGIVFFLPYYERSGTLGGGLLATYINNFYNIIFSFLHFYAKAPAIIGALWLMPKELLEKCGKNGRLLRSVSDDRELGFAVAELGFKNYLIPRTVKMPSDNISFNESINHLGKWFGMVRAEGLPVYIIFAILWNPTICSLISLVVALFISFEYVLWSLILFSSVIIIRSIGNITLNKFIYKLPIFTNIPMTIAYDILLFPLLFFINLFKTTIEWKGKVYKLGKHGKILSMD